MTEQHVTWRKSSHSDGDGNCLEVATKVTDNVIGIRHSKDPTGPVLTFPADAWQAFVSSLRAGEFDS